MRYPCASEGCLQRALFWTSSGIYCKAHRPTQVRELVLSFLFGLGLGAGVGFLILLWLGVL
jgi:hypothetical protein